ncbi:GNAT family N-acetyltransferase [Mucilaginibacter psychrotolerans]|uniref:N-acetyltransferase n=1 Tax=Mucilaginibacter psychrotolerans TaxID=1524096 RepID=A0A4Y8SJD3_9SPHI|nr:GNAT family N-acetyltransferase [Mucilaginibacter psychrotolerans]TFF39169.1 N-acetyltransferase [Mucilaginibacter psychrotolerans]
MNYDNIALINNEAIHNFELFVDGYRAFIDYKTKDNKIYLIHTEVPKELQGQGVAEAIVEKAFKYIEAHHLILIPLCTYVQVFLRKHPEWDRLLAA